MFWWMRARLLRPFGATGVPPVLFVPGDWPTIRVPRQGGRAAAGTRSRTIKDPRMGARR